MIKVSHPKWDRNLIDKSMKAFDLNTYNKRRKYLINIDELSALNLDPLDKYDRIRYLYENDAERERIGKSGHPPKERSLKTKGEVKKSYSKNSWSCFY